MMLLETDAAFRITNDARSSASAPAGPLFGHSRILRPPRPPLMSDRLAHAKSRPLFIERAIRTALREAMAWRIGGGGAPDAEAFATAAIAAVRLALDGCGADSAERSYSLAAVKSAARRFTASALYRRLMLVPAARLLRLRRLPNGPDAVLRDGQRRLHAIVVSIERDAFEASRIAANAARATPLQSADRLNPLTVHVFSLASAKRHTFECDVTAAASDRSGARVA